jgi:hypothetical protein
MVEVQASFRALSRFSDEVEVVLQIEEFRRSSFLVQHQLFNRAVLAVECLKTRVWARRSPTLCTILCAPGPEHGIDDAGGGRKRQALQFRREIAGRNG